MKFFLGTTTGVVPEHNRECWVKAIAKGTVKLIPLAQNSLLTKPLC